MIGQSILFAIGAGLACGLGFIAVVAYGIGLHRGLWFLVPAGIGAAVAVVEYVRMKRTPLDEGRPGIVPGDE